MTRLFGVLVATVLAAFLFQTPAKAMNECDDLFNSWSGALDMFEYRHGQAENNYQAYMAVEGTDAAANYARLSYYDNYHINSYLADSWLDTAFGYEDQMTAKGCIARIS